MEIELIKKEQEEKKVRFEDLEIGTVIEFIGSDGVNGLVIRDKSVLLLNYSGGNEWMNIYDGHSWERDFKVIGKATKLTVEEI